MSTNINPTVSTANRDNVTAVEGASSSPAASNSAPPPPPFAHCSTYTFPEEERRSPEQRGHLRSVSHGGAGVVVGRSALKGARGHQRALSQGQIFEPHKPGHSRVGSKTDFILPPDHKENQTHQPTPRTSAKGHSRQASRSDSIYTLRRTAPPPLWRRLLYALVLRRPKNDPEERYRVVVPNHVVPPHTPRKEHPNGRRPDNRIRTTKYTLLSFVPRNLLEQFHRVANLYFIFIVLLNFVPSINAFGKEIAMVPVMFVLFVTAVKDLFEDRRRHVSDKRINNSTCRIYNREACRYRKVLWKEVKVGDLIHLSNNEVVPADILLLRSSDHSGLCYIDTGHLDGETNLKQRQVARGFVEKQGIFEPSKFRSKIEVESPTTKIYRFHGAIVHPDGSRVPIGTDNLLLRECLIKNTDFVEGIVVYAGHETKAMLNNGGPRYKRSSVEKQMNQDVIWCVFILIFMCVIGAVGCKIWLTHYQDLPPPFQEGDSSGKEAFLAFWTFIIILQIMIPLSLYVTLEMCKIIQVYHIHNNSDLYDPVNDKRTECRALNITEELGQVQYIFSDKTGTLTENRMIFRRCAIAGIDYEHSLLDESHNDKLTNLSVAVNPRLLGDWQMDGTYSEELFSSRTTHSDRIQEFLLLLALCNTVVCSNHPHHDFMNASGIIEDTNIYDKLDQNSSENSSTTTTQSSFSNNDKYARLEESRSVTPSPPLTTYSLDNNKRSPHVPTLSPIDSIESSPTCDLTDVANTDNGRVKITRPKLLNITSKGFLKRCSNLTDEQKAKLTASGTATPSPHDAKPIFEAESPDELALVDAAYNYGVRLTKRTPTSVSVETSDAGRMHFEILNVLPFDSVRKRMSIVVRHPQTKQIILYTKGADSTILPQLTPVEDDSEQKAIINKTQQHINNYSKEGLRILVMAKRTLAQHQYDEWYKKHREIEFAVDNLERRIRDSYSSIECNLTLLGATGIEDRLQEGVPEALASLISAGIVIWVLTGDKPETAINIAYSAKLFSPQMELLKIFARSKEAAETTIHCYLSDIERMERDEQQSSSSTSASSNKTKKTRALAVDGKTLTFILDRRANLTKPFLKLTTYCNSVLCCRATPLQKAYIVRVVKEELKKRTLAIGDGANDVSMIQTADVGVGISGQEGLQAVMAADFTLPRFKYLETFLLVHGHWSYDRLSRMVLYFFYKNAAFVFLCFWYQLYCGFSGTVMIDQMYLMLYNLLFTSLPPLAIGVYDQDAPQEVLLKNPYLYRRGRLGKVYRSFSFWLTMLDALYQSMAIFFICQLSYNDTDADVFEFGTATTTAGMFVMLLHAGIEMRSWTIIHLASIVLSIGAFYLYSILYNTYCINCFGLPSTYWTIQITMSRPTYWLATLLSCVVALLPRVLYRVSQTIWAPDEVSRSLIYERRAARRGEKFLVSWSRSTSSSSVYRTNNSRHQNNSLTTVG